MKSFPYFLATAVLAFSAVAHADDWPSKPIKFIVPFPPGGPTDMIGRTAADILSKQLKATVVVENRPGANGVLGLDVLSKAPPDGYTVGITAITLATAPHLGLSKWDPFKDFTPISNMVATTPIFVANNAAPYNNLKELTAYAKANPNKVAYGTPGVATIPHLAAELFQSQIGAKFNHIPYKGAVQQITDLIGGQTQFDSQSSLVVALPFIKDKRIKPLAVMTETRSPALPDVPTAKESGYPEMVVVPWFGVGGPGGLPPEITKKMHEALVKGLAEKETQDKLIALGNVLLPSKSPQEFATYIRDEYNRWGKVIKDANIKIE
ncbi:Bug family tripartite tricarboxylate transporter substrate binding protein [Ottowia thiooxydans]|uniref:Bug family tripartite tricarboxylate transporter substrate binding protein n=1 Tax=Ottowia thiooxydans TaxID=219182 RepID=UPI00040C2BF8|nr:tripartite tricarboxylate transporter substrate binding protein [Ottowia thiooxydans]